MRQKISLIHFVKLNFIKINKNSTIMVTFKKTLGVLLILVALKGFAQTSITQDISTDKGKLKIRVEKDENGKKSVFDKTFDTEGMSQNERQALIDHITDSLTTGSGRNMKMRVKIDREEDATVYKNDDNADKKANKKVIIKKNGKTIEKSIEDENMDQDIDIQIDGDSDFNFEFDGKDFDMHDFEKNIGELGKTLQFKFKEFEPQMKRFGEEFGDKMDKLGKDMEPRFRKFEKEFKFENKSGSSKTVKNLNAYPNRPNNNKLNVEFTAPEKGNVTITVTDINGKEIGKERLSDFTGEYFGQVELKSAAKGTVFVTVVQGEDGNVKRVVVE
jgi:Secretion system C-terminal sorting domain